ncbi:tetratricopeptide repeat protein [Romboutsia ilealis]|uniref:tetratricopeptide repeat protein n=1 Tax=Romboutsia ilealis TaxID=1115758 RepID=UPI00272B28C7|nr:tetratricopeptide repeat protein [Romboutsia ilealis]
MIEPYVILTLLYDKIGNQKKKEYYLDRLEQVDKDNPLFEKKIDNKSEETKIVKKKIKKKINIIPYAIAGILVIAMGAYHISNKNKIEHLNAQLNKKNEKIEDIDQQLSEASEKLEETNHELDKTNQQLDEAKKQEMLVASEVDLYQKAVELKVSKNYTDAIAYFKKVIEYGKTKKYIAESIYQVAFLSEKTKNYDQAIKYYKKYINTYTKDDQYYDDAFYQLGMLYYENGDLENAKKTFYGMKSEVPDSMYNNSKVKEILSN